MTLRSMPAFERRWKTETNVRKADEEAEAGDCMAEEGVDMVAFEAATG